MSQVTLKGDPVQIGGSFPKAGDAVKDFNLANNKRENVNLESYAGKKKILNISSGAAVNPYESWSLYCTSKAGVDMMTKVLSKEQKRLKKGVKIVSIYPGIVDTDMQEKARNTPKEKENKKNEFKNIQTLITRN